MSEPTPDREFIQLLGSQFEIRSNVPELHGWLQMIVPRPSQDIPIVYRETVSVTRAGEEYRITGDGGDDDFELSLSPLLDTLFQRLNARAIAALPEHVAVRAACGRVGGGSFLLAGPRRSGKSVLAVQMLIDGVEIAGDELTLLRDREAMPFPRKFLLAEDAVSLLPPLAKVERFADIARRPRAQRILPLDPRDLAKPWRIVPAPVAAIFYLDPNFGAARTTLRRCAKIEMLQRLVPLCAPPPSRRRNWLADISATVDRADTFLVGLGDLASASTAIAAALDGARRAFAAE